MPALGIGIITYNRPSYLHSLLQAITRCTFTPYCLVIADDGSAYDDIAHVRKQGHMVVSGHNRGVCWNKNRALHTLLTRTDCDPIILLEDDCHPYVRLWEDDWILAAGRWHHVGFAHPGWPRNWCRGGNGSWHDPWRSHEMTGQATITSRDALQKVGYLDTNFKGYGFGHIEWTERFCKAGYMRKDGVLCMSNGLQLLPGPTYRNQDEIVKNYQVIQAARKRPFEYVPPWRYPDERQLMETEIDTACKLHGNEVLRVHDPVSDETPVPVGGTCVDGLPAANRLHGEG
jgi:GT2 family glycosyltransferase